MKNPILYLLLLFCLPGKLTSQSFTPYETYTYSRTYLEPVTYNAGNPNANNNAKQIQSVQYTDGLGRPRQDIAIGATYNGNDLVTGYFYDPVTGRQDKQYLPVVKSSTQGGMQSLTETDINSYYGVANAFAEVKTEDSPLGRPTETAAPGDDWKMAGGKTKKVEYLFNGLNEVKKYTAVSDDNEGVFEPAVTQSGNYARNVLYKIKSTDEDGNVTLTYKNSLGQTLMTRQVNGSEKLDTRYVYNQYGQLVMIIPPKAAALATLDQAARDQLCYIYRYDAKGRLIEKKLPGKGKEEMVYDKADRLILYRDAGMRGDDRWLLTKYDRFGRVLYTGFLPGGDRTNLQNIIGALVITEDPSSTGFTRNGLQVYYSIGFCYQMDTVLSVNYYDTYPAGSPSKPSSLTETALPGDVLAERSTKSLPTASYVKNIGDDKWTKTWYWYDMRGRSIGGQETNHLGGITVTHTQMDWAGLAQKVETIHQRLATSDPVTVTERFEYNERNYLRKHYHQVDTNPEELLAEYTYNELGQVTNKKVGNNIQSIDYSYNVRGWLTGVNNVGTIGDKLFAYKINYTQRDGLETPNLDYPALHVQPQYNGNIAEVAWKAVESMGSAPPATPHRQGFVYDGAGRVQAGFYQLPDDPAIKANSEIIENYDLNGNIINLKRTGGKIKGVVKMIDNLTYSYQGNRLTSVADASMNAAGYEGGGGAITYDDNGNMTAMPDKGISSISYNFLNLPEEIDQTNVSTFYYRADGVKTRKKLVLNNGAGSNTTVTDYLDGFVYTTPGSTVLREALDEQDPNTVAATHAGEQEVFTDLPGRIPPGDPPQDMTLSLAYFPTSEGYYDYRDNRYIYQYKDHLGNVRLSYGVNPDTDQIEILDRNDYYPFGMNMQGYSSAFDTTGAIYNYKYNQKELQETGFYDYGWRQYMPDLGRWFGVDKLAETYNSHSPYAYVMNNPISLFDPDGRKIQPIEGGWEFTGDDIKMLSDYFSNGGSFGNLTSQLDSFNSYFGSGATSPFWNSFNGGVKVQNNYMTWATDGTMGTKQNEIQEIVLHKKKIDQNDLGAFMNKMTKDNEKTFAEWDKISKMLGGFGFANDVKTTMIEQAGKLGELTKATSNYLKVFKGVGTVTNLVSSGYTAYQLYNNPTAGNAARLAVQGIAVGTAFIPVVGWGISLGIGAADMIWGDDFYNWIDKQ